MWGDTVAARLGSSRCVSACDPGGRVRGLCGLGGAVVLYWAGRVCFSIVGLGVDNERFRVGWYLSGAGLFLSSWHSAPTADGLFVEESLGQGCSYG